MAKRRNNSEVREKSGERGVREPREEKIPRRVCLAVPYVVKASSEMTEELSLAIWRLWEILTKGVSVQRWKWKLD